MLTYDERTVYESWMEKGYNAERNGKWNQAKNIYSDAKELADMENDEGASLRAQERIDVCDANLEMAKGK